jgi:hypothetical protein
LLFLIKKCLSPVVDIFVTTVDDASPAVEAFVTARDVFVTAVDVFVTARPKASTVRPKASTAVTKASTAGEKTFFYKKKRKGGRKLTNKQKRREYMAKVQVKRIKEKALKIQNAWNEGAPDVTEFRNTKKADYDARIALGQSLDDDIEALRAQVSMKEDQRDNVYSLLDDDNVDVGKGVVGHKDYGDDSPLYGSMGFVRKSERQSGLTHKTKDGGSDEGEDK